MLNANTDTITINGNVIRFGKFNGRIEAYDVFINGNCIARCVRTAREAVAIALKAAF